MKSTKHIILGLPASGKTTFLAAMWHLIEAGEAQCAFALERVEGDVGYLNKIAEAWRTFEKVPRTSQVGDVDVSMFVRDRKNDQPCVMVFPDLAGETFDAEVEARRCVEKYVSGFDGDDGILLFVSSDVTQDHLSIVDLNKSLPSEYQEDKDESRTHVAPTADPAQAIKSPVKIAEQDVSQKNDQHTDSPIPVRKEWQSKLLPAQVRVVQILSDLLRPPFALRQRRLAVVISAWDLLPEPRPIPSEWLKNNMSLVWQFLNTNRSSFESKVYGISAQGVDLKQPEAVKAAAKLPASKRIIVAGPNASGHDLTAPIRWLMTGE